MNIARIDGEQIPEQANEVVYPGGEVSRNSGITRSSLTKNCIALGNKGYGFIRGANNSKALTSKDTLPIQGMKELIQDKSMIMETSVNVVLSLLPENERHLRGFSPQEQNHIAVPVVSNHLKYSEDISNKLDSMEKELEDLKIQNELLQNQNIQLKQTMDKSLNNRDENFSSLIHEVQETKRIIPSSQEKKKGFFKKVMFFSPSI
ncbi:hypothetical protein BEH_25070 (plasmid) [Priestia filamentosa]|uniref:DUF3967 domain-containing protein n=1 Tax=Priestia filamentosa TaxID=1402861 RepID=A0A2S1LZL6_9BACI|nr:DUF3967 domain-containing protein [Priestia filamentosa]AWG44262.1 hypothetical protein BEH_25070 [Priestia filamentosa]